MEQTDSMVVLRPKGWFRPRWQRRTREDGAALRLLADNLEAIGFLNALVANPDGEIIAGHRRYQAAMLKESILELPVRIVSDPLTAREVRIRRVSENLQRADLSLFDKWLECKGFRDDEPGILAADIATALNVDNSTITRYLCLDHCVDEVRQAAMEERLSLRAAYELSKAPREHQAELLPIALKGGAERVAKARQRLAEPEPLNTPKVLNLKIRLAGGKTIVIKGENSLAEVAELLRKAAIEVDEAKKQKLDPKTFERVMADRSKARDEPAGLVRAKA